MAFPRKLLNEGEEVILDLRPHWSKLVVPSLALIGAIVLTILAAAFSGGTLVIVALVPLAAAVIFLLIRYAKWTTTNFVVTNERLIHREGVVAKKGIEIPLDRVQTITFNQSVLERIIGAGDLMIESAGETGQNRFTDIRKPGTVQAIIYREMEAYEERRVDRMAGNRGGGTSVASELEKLHQLLRAGAISQAEYDAQKARLLSG